MKRDNLAVTVLAIAAISLLEVFAIWKGIDGRALAVAMAAIALLAPSPLFQIKFGQYQIEKKSEEK